MTRKQQASSSQGIDYFNRGHWLTNIQVKVSLGARQRMFRIWENEAGDVTSRSVLDVGATPDVERADSNCMIPWLQEKKMRVTLYSPEAIEHLSRIFPGTDVIAGQAGDGRLPVPDRSFDWVTSSAVLEHVGSFEQQAAFIRECARAGRNVFLTTPNRGHWLEFHTKLPLIHWLPRALHRGLLRALGKSLWAQESHLRLVSRSELARMAENALSGTHRFEIHTIWTLGMPSNLVLLAFENRSPGA